MTVTVNGTVVETASGTTLTELLTQRGFDPAGKGFAVAVDGEVVPRGEWAAHVLTGSARVEVVGAVQGG